VDEIKMRAAEKNQSGQGENEGLVFKQTEISQ
jgi:hypothetical protein